MNACMRLRFGAYGLVALAASAGPVLAQAQQYAPRNAEPSNSAIAADQAIQPNVPTFQSRAPLQPRAAEQPAASQQPAPQAPAPPFTLTPQQQAQVDRVLDLWEKHNETIKTFDCYFKRWTYDTIFAKSDKPDEARFVEMGILKYKAPDHGRFCVESAERNGKVEPIGDARAEQWVSDGKSIFEFKYAQKQLIEHVLPPHLQGKAISDTPLPFLFGSEAQKLKQRYWIKIITPDDVTDQIWLLAYPRFQQEAANFSRAELRINAKDMTPVALSLLQPNEKDHTTYVFYNVVVNDPLQMPFFHMNPFRPMTPFGWRKIVEQPPPQQPQGQPQAQARQPAMQRR